MNLGPTLLTSGVRSFMAALALLIAVIAGATSQVRHEPVEATAAEGIASREDGSTRIIEPRQAPLVRSPDQPNFGLRGKGLGKTKHTPFTTQPAQTTLAMCTQPRHRWSAAGEPTTYALLRTQNPRAPPAT